MYHLCAVGLADECVRAVCDDPCYDAPWYDVMLLGHIVAQSSISAQWMVMSLMSDVSLVQWLMAS